MSSEYQQKILEEIWKDDSKDVTFEVEGKEVKCHKFIIRTLSETFKTRHESTNTIPLEDEKYDVFSVFVEFLYTGELNLDFENIEQFLCVAEKWGVDILQQKCVAYLQSEICDTFCFKVLRLGHKFKWPNKDIKEIALCQIAANLRTCEQIFEFDICDASDIRRIAELVCNGKPGDDDAERAACRIVLTWMSKNENDQVSQEVLQTSESLFRSYVTHDNVLATLKIGIRYENKSVIKFCTDVYLNNIPAVTSELLTEDFPFMDTLVKNTLQYSNTYLNDTKQKQLGHTILQWIEHEFKERETHIKHLFTEYNSEVSVIIDKGNVIKLFQLSVLHKSVGVQNTCLQYINEHATELINALNGLNIKDFEKVIEYMNDKERKTRDDKLRNIQKLVDSYIQLVRATEEKQDTALSQQDSMVFISSQDLLKKCNSAPITEATSADSNNTTKRQCTGYLVLSWIQNYLKQREPNDQQTLVSAIERLLRNFYIDIRDILTTTNVIALYSLSVVNSCSEMEAICFEYCLKNFRDLPREIVSLSENEFLKMMECIDTLYKKEDDVKTIIGEMLMEWMRPRNADVSDVLDSLTIDQSLNIKSVRNKLMSAMCFSLRRADAYTLRRTPTEAYCAVPVNISSLEPFREHLNCFLNCIDASKCPIPLLLISKCLQIDRLSVKVRDVCITDFENVLCSKRFVEMQFSDLEIILCNDKLNVAHELQVAKGIIRWHEDGHRTLEKCTDVLVDGPSAVSVQNKHLQHAQCLMRHVRFHSIPYHEIMNLMYKHEIIFDDSVARRKALVAVEYHTDLQSRRVSVSSINVNPRKASNQKLCLCVLEMKEKTIEYRTQTDISTQPYAQKCSTISRYTFSEDIKAKNVSMVSCLHGDHLYVIVFETGFNAQTAAIIMIVFNVDGTTTDVIPLGETLKTCNINWQCMLPVKNHIIAFGKKDYYEFWITKINILSKRVDQVQTSLTEYLGQFYLCAQNNDNLLLVPYADNRVFSISVSNGAVQEEHLQTNTSQNIVQHALGDKVLCTDDKYHVYVAGRNGCLLRIDKKTFNVECMRANLDQLIIEDDLDLLSLSIAETDFRQNPVNSCSILLKVGTSLFFLGQDTCFKYDIEKKTDDVLPADIYVPSAHYYALLLNIMAS